jgi:hypothetical protein
MIALNAATRIDATKARGPISFHRITQHALAAEVLRV